MRFRVKPILAKPFTGPLLAIDRYISFYGEVDIETSIYRPLNIPVAHKVLLFRGSRGSTVGSYVIYGLWKRGKGPLAVMTKDLDNVLVAGCVLTDTPLLMVYDYDYLISSIRGEDATRFNARYEGGEYIEIEKW